MERIQGDISATGKVVPGSGLRERERFEVVPTRGGSMAGRSVAVIVSRGRGLPIVGDRWGSESSVSPPIGIPMRQYPSPTLVSAEGKVIPGQDAGRRSDAPSGTSMASRGAAVVVSRGRGLPIVASSGGGLAIMGGSRGSDSSVSPPIGIPIRQLPSPTLVSAEGKVVPGQDIYRR